MTHYLTSSTYSSYLLLQLLSTTSSNNLFKTYLPSNTFSMLQTLHTKVHLLQVPRYARLFHFSQIHRSQIRTFRSSTRLNTNEYTDVFATKINKVEADVSALKTDIKKLEYSMKEQLAGYALNQQKQLSQHAHNQVKQSSELIYRSIWGVLGFTMLLVGGSCILPIIESKRLDAEIKRRTIV